MPGDDDDDDFGPSPVAPRAPSPHALAISAALAELPDKEMYEKSWMHRDRVLHIVVTGEATQFVVTASADGQVKFWKLSSSGVLEFVKTYNAHRGAPSGLACSADGEHLVSTCASADERALRFYLVRSFDLFSTTAMADGDAFAPGAVCWVSRAGAPKPLVLVADQRSPAMRLYDNASNDALREIKMHAAPVVALAYCAKLRCAVSGDQSGALSLMACAECAAEDEWTFPNKRVARQVKFKMDSDLYELAKLKVLPLALCTSSTHFAVTCSDAKTRVFDIATCRIVCALDESAARYEPAAGGMADYHLEDADVAQRLERERALEQAMASRAPPLASVPQCVFDASGRVLLMPTVVGVKLVDFMAARTLRVLGTVEAGERFTAMALFQGAVSDDHQIQKSMAAAADTSMRKQEGVLGATDGVDGGPLLVCAAFGRDRFYVFSQRDPPDEGRDVFNEKSTKRQQMEQLEAENAKRAAGLPRSATLHTTLGDVELKLFAVECPRTVENFVGLARKGYYDDVVFHRVIRGFMVQTGDPRGDGTGGESLWGGNFEDEFAPGLAHDVPYTLSMANCGKNTNGSQFFITTVPTPHLDGKHTVFGRVVRGQDTVQRIEGAKTDASDRPLSDVRIINVTIA